MHELEEVISKMIDQHDLQKHEIVGLVMNYIDFHYPNAEEEFTDGTKPFYYAGHLDGVDKALRKARKSSM